MKPLDIYETDFGFRGSGEGIVYEYSKSKHKHGDPEISYFILTRNRATQRQYLLFYSRRMGMQSIRRNVEIREDFSKYFKRDMFRLSFQEKSNLNSLKKALNIIKEI